MQWDLIQLITEVALLLFIKILIYEIYFASDINECVTNKGYCSQICNNRDGSYSCSCYAGYQLLADNISCNGE